MAFPSCSWAVAVHFVLRMASNSLWQSLTSVIEDITLKYFFFGNQFCSFMFLTIIIFAFSCDFFKFKFEFNFIQKDYKSIKNFKKSWEVLFFQHLSGFDEIHQMSGRNFQKTKKNNAMFCFLIFLFIITETNIKKTAMEFLKWVYS